MSRPPTYVEHCEEFHCGQEQPNRSMNIQIALVIIVIRMSSIRATTAGRFLIRRRRLG